ncbi:MAG: ribosome biogenesis GTPase YlqF [Bacilli bacterium]|nr:ribosome biogenesis GTPase YlqF [Bacilli bacterium]
MSEKTVYQKNVHYFPGHMKKALNELSSSIKLVDVVIEVMDARAPLASHNPYLSTVLGDKPRMIVLSKSDYADPLVTEKWIEYFASKGIIALSLDLKKEKVFSKLIAISKPLVEKKRAKEKKYGMKPQPIRLLVVGVPNVGKSTLINNLAGKAAAKAGNKPGVTRAEQFIKLPHDFILLDTPGILPMNYEDEEDAIKLALTGSIKEEILPLEKILGNLIEIFKHFYPHALQNRFMIDDISSMELDEILLQIAKNRNYVQSGSELDLERASFILIKEYRDGVLGRYSLEQPDA